MFRSLYGKIRSTFEGVKDKVSDFFTGRILGYAYGKKEDLSPPTILPSIMPDTSIPVTSTPGNPDDSTIPYVSGTSYGQDRKDHYTVSYTIKNRHTGDVYTGEVRRNQYESKLLGSVIASLPDNAGGSGEEDDAYEIIEFDYAQDDDYDDIHDEGEDDAMYGEYDLEYDEYEGEY